MSDPELSWEEAVLVASGGVPYLPQTQRDPIAAWIELMEVVEILCPRRPERPLVIGKDYRL
ncbi:MAG TPA: hypothetical protein VGT79_00455 [Xanthomonadaceae bacterium]|nr:hypothetical protein [Xanthomonadaceae bacterium]